MNALQGQEPCDEPLPPVRLCPDAGTRKRKCPGGEFRGRGKKQISYLQGVVTMSDETIKGVQIHHFSGGHAAPERPLQELEMRNDANFYAVLRRCLPLFALLTDEQLGRVMRTVIENNGKCYAASEEEGEALAAILTETIQELL